jgi:hypothetical protein
MRAKENANGIIIVEVTVDFLIKSAISGVGSIKIENVGKRKYLTYLTACESNNGRYQQIKLICAISSAAEKSL